MHPWGCMRGVCPPATSLRNDCDPHVHRSRTRWQRCIRATRPTNISIPFGVSSMSTYKLWLGTTATVRGQSARRQVRSWSWVLLANRSLESGPASRLDFGFGLDGGGRDDHGGGRARDLRSESQTEYLSTLYAHCGV